MRLVMKFGGTGVNSASKVKEIANLIKAHHHDATNDLVVVVSAIRGMTDDIISITDNIKDGQKVSVENFMKKTRAFHLDILRNAIKDEGIMKKASLVVSQVLDELENV